MRSLLGPLLASLSVSPAAAIVLGVNTHFEQGWPLAAFDKVAQAKAAGIRESVNWGKIERQPGVYDFTPVNSGFLAHACERSVPVLLVLAPRNPIYAGGKAITSEIDRRAFARFARTIVERFPCITALEIGNEINAPNPAWPRGAAKAVAYVAILKEVRGALMGLDRRVALIGGSSLMVATGFLDQLFAAGMLPLVDGIAVHPYADFPEQLPLQFDRLASTMRRHGAIKPVWATEFGLYYKTPEAAPPHALKVITLMSAAKVSHAYWYALLDEKWFPNMGLFAGRQPKPALAMFQLAVEHLLSAGDARRVETGDDPTFIYRFGDGPYVMWGSGHGIRFTGKVSAFDAQGRGIAVPNTLGPEPVMITASGGFVLEPPRVLADTNYDYAEPHWSRAIVTADRAETPLRWIDSNWSSYLGVPARNFQANAAAVLIDSGAKGDVALVERYISAKAQKLWLSTCIISAKPTKASVRISSGGRTLYSGAVAAGSPPLLALPLTAGSRIEIRYMAGAGEHALFLKRRLRLLTVPDSAPPLCPAPGGGTPQ